MKVFIITLLTILIIGICLSVAQEVTEDINIEENEIRVTMKHLLDDYMKSEEGKNAEQIAKAVTVYEETIEIPLGEEDFYTSITSGESKKYSILSGSNSQAKTVIGFLTGEGYEYFQLTGDDFYMVAIIAKPAASSKVATIVYNILFTINVLPNTPAGTYDLTLTTSIFDSSDRLVGGYVRENFHITVEEGLPQAPSANFSADQTSGSEPLIIQFADSSTGDITTWLWDFGDGTESNVQNPQHTYENTGTYTVTLTVSGPEGTDIKTITDYITVTEPVAPIADFTAEPLSGELPITVQFTDQSTGTITDWEWDFGDGETSNTVDPSHEYQDVGMYTVTLTVNGPLGTNSKTHTNYITVTPPPPPVADFIADPLSGEMPLIVQFIDQSTGTITGWLWDFGDGETSTAQNPSHEYHDIGTYTVTLTVMGPLSSDGKTRTDYITVTPPPPPVADFTFGPTSGVAPLTVQFTDLSTGTITGWLWDFGDGKISIKQNPSHTYTDKGIYVPELAVTGSFITDTKQSKEYIIVHPQFPEQKLTASDASVSDWFGYSVSISGSTAIVGAYKDDDGGNDSGSAYIIVREGNMWVQQTKLVASDAKYGDWFGYSVSISGNSAIVGAYGYDGVISNSGTAYIFVRVGDSWMQQSKLVASDAAWDDRFGRSVSINGNTAIVGAYSDDDGGTNSGSAYIFVCEGDNWVQQAKLTASDAAENDYFGWSVSINGNTAIVGAYGDNDGGSESGSAYIFVREGDNWVQQAKLVASDAAYSNVFGVSVSIYGSTAIVGSTGDRHGGYNSGSAYIFVREGDNWVQQAKLVASDASSNDVFGVSVSITSSTVIVGAYGEDGGGSDSGSTYIFVRNGDNWIQQAKLVASDAAKNDHFGVSVSISGSTLIVGAPDDDDGGVGSGSAYCYSLGEEQPISGIMAFTESDSEPQTIHFSALSTGTITGCEWDFGDGQNSADINPVHTYESAGNYLVTLTVTCPEGTDTITKNLEVEEPVSLEESSNPKTFSFR